MRRVHLTRKKKVRPTLECPGFLVASCDTASIFDDIELFWAKYVMGFLICHLIQNSMYGGLKSRSWSLFTKILTACLSSVWCPNFLPRSRRPHFLSPPWLLGEFRRATEAGSILTVSFQTKQIEMKNKSASGKVGRIQVSRFKFTLPSEKSLSFLKYLSEWANLL